MSKGKMRLSPSQKIFIKHKEYVLQVTSDAFGPEVRETDFPKAFLAYHSGAIRPLDDGIISKSSVTETVGGGRSKIKRRQITG